MGYIAYEGPSRIDGKPIVCIVTGVGDRKADRSKNEKTGPMAQSWILRSDISPLDAISSGEDESICGSCPLRGIIEKMKGAEPINRLRPCYVTVRNAPRQIYEAYHRGLYTPLEDATWRTQATRLGSYGDPAAMPYKVSVDLIRRGNGKNTGYTHQHSDRRFRPMRKLVMASVHTVDQALKAQSEGWRTFRTMQAGDTLMDNEILCPASKEAGYRLTCETCKACSGTGVSLSRHKAVNVALYAHGSKAVLSSYKKIMELSGLAG